MENLVKKQERLQHDGRLFMDFAKRYDKTVLVDLFHRPALKASKELYMNPNDRSEATVYMMESSGGLMAGDKNKYKINLAENASVCLIPQSATIIYPSNNVEHVSCQNMQISLEENSKLFWKTEATIPFKDARFNTETIISMKESSTLLWGEIIAPGRLKRDEKFEYNFFNSNFQVWIDNKCLIFDKFAFNPDEMDFNVMGLLEEHTYIGSIWFVGPKASSVDVDLLNEKIQNASDLSVGISLIDNQGINFRWLASDLILLKKEMEKIWSELRSIII